MNTWIKGKELSMVISAMKNLTKGSLIDSTGRHHRQSTECSGRTPVSGEYFSWAAGFLPSFESHFA